MKNHSHQDTTLDISIIGLMSALVFVGTYFFKIPSAFGYTHLGDCMIILTVCLFGTRRGVLAGAIGADNGNAYQHHDQDDEGEATRYGFSRPWY